MSVRPTPIPTFCIFKVDPALLISQYKAGAYSVFTIPKINISSGDISEQGLVNQSHGNSSFDPSFSFNTRSGTEAVFVTTNNARFKSYHLGSNIGGGISGECSWCGLKYKELGGIPVAVTHELDPSYKHATTGGDGGGTVPPINNEVSDRKMCFWLVDELCDYRCALAHILSVSRGSTRFNTNNAESWLRIMYELAYPNGEPLLPAPHRSHLKKNGGTCTEEQYKSVRYTFSNTQCFVLAPAKSLEQRVVRT